MALIDTAKREKEGSQKLPTRYYSKKQEDTIAKKLGGQRIKNSGATPWQKGDIHLDKWLLEAKTKTTASKSMSIQKEWLEKNVKEALFQGKPYTALAFNFGPDEQNYYIIDEELFEKLVTYIDEEETE